MRLTVKILEENVDEILQNQKTKPTHFGKCAEEGRIKTTYVFRAHGSLLLIMFKCLRYVQEQQVSHGAKVTTIKG